MKPQTPLATLPKTRQRRQLTRDVRRYQKAGGRIQQLDTGTARGLCPVNLDDIAELCGYYREL